MRKQLFLYFIILLFAKNSFAQMLVQNDTLYGDEWISFDQSYFKIKVASEGLYHIPFDLLQQVGIPLSEINASQFQLFAYGSEIPIYTSTDDKFMMDDYIEFYGQKNLGYIDQFLYQDSDKQQLNPKYSLFNDSMAYFLTWNESNQNIRYKQLNNELTGNLPIVESHYQAKKTILFNNSYNKASFNGSAYIRFSNFDIGEGYASSLKSNHNYDINIDHIADIGNDVKLILRTGCNAKPHNTTYTFNNQSIHTTNYSGYRVSQLSIPIAKNDLKSNNKLNIKDKNSNERTSVAYLSLEFPRTFHADLDHVFEFEIEAHSTDKYFEIENFNTNGESFILIDINNGERLKGIFSGTFTKFLLPPTIKKRKLVLVNSQDQIHTVDPFKPVHFTDYSISNPDYLILTSERLNLSNNGTNPIQKYTEFRKSIAGGSHQVSIIDVETLYDQYAYGINRHSISIRNFVNKLIPIWTNWEYAFIIGKGLGLKNYRKPNQIETNKDFFFVPTYGKTGSDNLLFAGLNQFYPQLAIGRLAATTAADIDNYLDKITSQSSYLSLEQKIKDKLWTKKILHLGGGLGANQQNSFKGELNNLKSIIENNQFGGNVKSYFKTSSDIIQSATSDELIDYINNGVAIISFLGHSSAGSFDFNIEQVGAYNNKGKYPLLLSMGCYSGDIHKVNGGLSQDFVLKKEKGVIAFVASDGTAYANDLTRLARNFYNLLGSSSNNNRSIGWIWKTIYEQNKNNTAIGNTTLTQQNTLHGDPAIVLYHHEGPDYITDFESVNLDPQIISTSNDHFEVRFDVVNLGRGVSDSMNILIEQVSDEDSILFHTIKRIKAPKYSEQIVLTIPIENKKLSIGENTLYVQLDPENEILESPNAVGEANNELRDQNQKKGFPFYIVDNNIKTIYPTPFGIISEKIELYASVANLFVDDQNYIIQIDTTINFNNPIDQTLIHQGGGLLSWQPSFNPEVGTVYYWRVSPDSTSTNVGYIWSQSSFLYSGNSSKGWNQSHVQQLQQDFYKDLHINDVGKLEFQDNFIAYKVINRLREIAKYPNYIINNSVVDYNNGIDIKAGVYVIVSDPIFAQPWINPKGGAYGSDTPINSGDRKVFPFSTTTEADRGELMDFLQNTIPDGYNVIVMNIQSIEDPSNANIWEEDQDNTGRSIFSVLQSQGATKINLLKTMPSLPYIFAYRKNIGIIDEIIGESSEEILDKTIYCTAKWYEGKVTSTLIGPSNSWKNLNWIESIEPSDLSTLSIQLFDKNRQYNSTVSVVNMASMEEDISFIDASIYPYIKLVYESKDTIEHTPSQLSQWQVIYDPLPELAINVNDNYQFHADTLSIGDHLRLDMTINNISSTDVDTFEIEYVITDRQNNQKITIDTINSIKSQSSHRIHYEFDTKNLDDNFHFSVKINKNNTPRELYQFNNVLLKEITLLKDETNPILDVRFDGIQIRNDDLISAHPNINIHLKDENKYLLLNEPKNIEITLLSPDGNKKIIDISDANITFTPGNETNNSAHIIYKPSFPTSGTYTLEVNAKDASGNTSGDQRFSVRFQIILEKSISNVLNYPNPFSSQTQFVFQLGGEDIPQYFSIRIISAAGKVVKEITSQEFGQVKLGHNISDYHWDGTDDYGNKLANGVYLYQVNIKQENGIAYKNISSSIDPYFKKGWGKLTILR